MLPDCYDITEVGADLICITVHQSPSLLTIETILGEVAYWIAIKGERLGVLVDIRTAQRAHTPLAYMRYVRFILRYPQVRIAVYGGSRMIEQQIALIGQMSRGVHQLRMFPDHTRALAWLLAERQVASPQSPRNGR